MTKYRYAGSACGLVLLGACGGGAGREPVGAAAEASITPPNPDVIRFLEQSSFGPTTASIAYASNYGISNALSQQFLAAPSYYVWNTTANTGTDIRDQFYGFAVGASDQLRQRVALALHEILVVSNIKVIGDEGMVPYLNILANDAFGNYQQLLQDITLNAAMGRFLSMANNTAFDGHGNAISPNENYARELMQLFTIGLWRLNGDGTLYQPIPGVFVPTYPQSTVENNSHVLTGWAYGGASCPKMGGGTLLYFGVATKPPWLGTPLQDCEVNHDTSAELLLDGYSTQAGWTATQGLETTINPSTMIGGVLSDLATDPNIAPFICKQLIQHLVTSNPAPGFVSDCVSTWDANLSSPTQLQQVVTTILTDRNYNTASAAAADANYGHLREPVLYVANVLRLLTTTATTQTTAAWNVQSTNMGQNIFNPPSVFSYFPPNQPLPGNTGALLGPEFGLLDTATVVSRANFVNKVLYGNIPSDTTLNLAGLMLPTTASDMIAWLDGYLLHGTMSSGLSGILKTALTVQGLSTLAMQKRGLYLVLTSAEYQIER